jgi:PAS domain S-box-containing protein
MNRSSQQPDLDRTGDSSRAMPPAVSWRKLVWKQAVLAVLLVVATAVAVAAAGHVVAGGMALGRLLWLVVLLAAGGAAAALLFQERLARPLVQLAEQVARSHAELEERIRARTEELTAANEAMQAEIADHQRTLRALRESEALYQTLVESLPLCVFRKDADGRIVFANSRLCATLGRSLIELMGKRDDEIFPAELAEKYRRDDAQITAEGKVLEREEEVDIDGNRIAVLTL